MVRDHGLLGESEPTRLLANWQIHRPPVGFDKGMLYPGGIDKGILGVGVGVLVLWDLIYPYPCQGYGGVCSYFYSNCSQSKG